MKTNTLIYNKVRTHRIYNFRFTSNYNSEALYAVYDAENKIFENFLTQNLSVYGDNGIITNFKVEFEHSIIPNNYDIEPCPIGGNWWCMSSLEYKKKRNYKIGIQIFQEQIQIFGPFTFEVADNWLKGNGIPEQILNIINDRPFIGWIFTSPIKIPITDDYIFFG